MIKARKDNLILLGLSHANLDRLRADGLKGGISIKGEELGVAVDIFITAAPTEAHMLDAIAIRIGPETQVRVDKKLKS